MLDCCARIVQHIGGGQQVEFVKNGRKTAFLQLKLEFEVGAYRLVKARGIHNSRLPTWKCEENMPTFWLWCTVIYRSSSWRRPVHHGWNVGVFSSCLQAGNWELCIPKVTICWRKLYTMEIWNGKLFKWHFKQPILSPVILGNYRFSYAPLTCSQLNSWALPLKLWMLFVSIM